MTLKSTRNGIGALDVIDWNRWLALSAVILALGTTMFSQTATRANRITQQVTSGAVVAVAGTVNPKVQRATDLGAVNSELLLESMTLNIGLSAAQQAEVDALIAAQQDPKSAQYHQWLTQEEFGARFGLSDSDLDKVTSWLRSQGFTVKSVSPSRNLITFSGKAWQVESAFHSQLHKYQLDGESHIANATELRIPAALASVVTRVGGLNSFRMKPHSLRRGMNPNFTSYLSGIHLLTPADWATIYDVNPIYSAGYTGTGMHVGVVGQTYFPTTDVDKFRAAAGLPAKNLTMFCISSTHCTDVTGESIGDMGEADLDVEWAGGIAQNATVDYIYASAADQNNDVISALIYAISTYRVNGSVVPVISMSYGACEFEISATDRSGIDSYLSEAATQGQTLVNSSGDEGAACSGSSNGVTIVTNGAKVSWPTSSPYVTGVGGTEFNGDGTAANPDLGADSYWNYSSTADIISSAISYIPESTWNDTAYVQSLSSSNTLSSGGGGVSSFYSLPSWQWAPTGYTGTSMRFVPDVSFSASPEHDPYLICTQLFAATATSASQTQGTSCFNGFRYSDNNFYGEVGGTSAGTPAFAGLLTLLVQKYGMLGNLNPTLYGLAKNSSTYATVFHDITTGTNAQPCTTGTGCSGGEVGYSALAGYDLATGLGSVDGHALYTALGAPLAATTTVVSASPNSVTMGDTTALIATITSTTAGTIGGSVTFSVGGHTIGSAPVSSGTASLSSVPVTAGNGFAAGSELVTATYGGDSTYASSSNTATLTVASAPTYTLTAASSTATIAAGTSSTISLSLVPTNYTGTVTFTTTVTSTNGTAANLTASVSSVTLTNGGTTTQIVIAPNASAANHIPVAPGKNGEAWKTGGTVIFCSVLLGAPFTFRRRKTLTVLLVAVAISLAAFTVACSGSSGTSKSPTLTATTTTVSASPSTVTLNGTTSLTATVSPSAATGTITFKVGSTSVGSATLSGGTAALANLPVNTTNGFTYGTSNTSNTVTASYSGDTTYAASSGTGTVTMTAPRIYTVTVTPTGSGTVTNPSPVVITVTVP